MNKNIVIISSIDYSEHHIVDLKQRVLLTTCNTIAEANNEIWKHHNAEQCGMSYDEYVKANNRGNK